MVEWKGQLEGKVGAKARRLDQVESFYVPNFFVVTKDEVEALVNGSRSPEEITSDSMPEELSDRLEEAYKEINMSSEVRKASGKARNLVGNQRNSSRVSVRVSADKDGSYDYRLNVGSSELEDALLEVVKSYYKNHSSGFPAVLVQKMVEPEASGAALKLEGGNVIEAVKGLGKALEEGRTVPDIYLPGTGQKRVPESQLETSVNPMSGDIRTRETARNTALLKDSQIRQLSEKLDSEKHSIKFAYSRGSFYAVDAFETPDLSVPEDLSGLQVSPGRIDRNAEVVEVADKVESPLYARNGGYTSRQAQQARRDGVPAVFSFKGELEEETEEKEFKKSRDSAKITEITVTEVLESDRELPSRLEEMYGIDFQQSYLESPADILKFDSGPAVLDARRMDPETARNAVGMLDAEFLCVVMEYPVSEVVEAAVENGAEAIAVEREFEEAEKAVLREEKRLILRHARE